MLYDTNTYDCVEAGYILSYNLFYFHLAGPGPGLFDPQQHMDNNIPFPPQRAYLTGLGSNSLCRHAP